MDATSPPSPPRTVALVGLMGAGKSAIGKRLAIVEARATDEAGTLVAVASATHALLP